MEGVGHSFCEPGAQGELGRTDSEGCWLFDVTGLRVDGVSFQNGRNGDVGKMGCVREFRLLDLEARSNLGFAKSTRQGSFPH